MAELSKWIEDQVAAGVKRAELAQRIGISRSYLAEIASGTKRPSLDVAFRIEKESGGSVPATSFIRHESAA